MTDFQKPEQSGQAAALPKTYTQHPLSAAFPAMSAEDFQALTDSIDNIGVQNPHHPIRGHGRRRMESLQSGD